jgi:ATP-binding cassette subfamily B protein
LISWKTLLRPHAKALALGLLAVIGETIADLLQPWTLKIVFDNVLKSGSVKAHGWLNQAILATVGNNLLLLGEVFDHQRRSMGDA